jgi:stress-induced morphogen
MLLTTSEVQELIEASIPGASVEVADLTGTSDHFDIRVTSGAFAGKSRIEQHKMVQAALGEHLTTAIHAVQIKTQVPE